MKWEKWQQFIRRKGLDPKVNRKKVGTILFITTVAVFLIFVLRLTYIVGVGEVAGTSLDEKTRELYQGSSVVKAKRGAIYDRNGFPIAEDATSYSLYAVLGEKYLGLPEKKTGKPEKLYVQDADKGTIARVLAKHLKDLKETEALDVLNKQFDKKDEANDYYQVEFGKPGQRLSLEVKNKIEEELKNEGIKGIYFYENAARFYPNGIFSSHMIGYTKIDEKTGLHGEMGIEQAFDKELSGKDGLVRYTKGSNQRPIPNTEVIEEEAVDGIDIYTTIDSALQMQLETKLDEIFEKYTPDDITVMLAEAETGNILAAGQRGTFNPTTLKEFEEEDAQWNNLLTDFPFEPGSTMKVFTMASAIETGVYSPSDYVGTGKIEVIDRKISDWNNGEGVGTISYRQAFAWSSNVAMVKLQQGMGDQWLDYMKRFGFGSSTESGLLLEQPGNIRFENEVDKVMTAYGQAISVTPFQMIQGMTAIANEGKMLKPNYISKIVHPDGTEEKIKPEVVGEPISASTANLVLDMMKDVVEDENYGTGKAFKLENHTVSAKTGTAEISDKNGYDTDGYLNSVVEIVPTEDPEFIIYVTMRKPNINLDGLASDIIAQISTPMLERALNVDAAHQLDDEE